MTENMDWGVDTADLAKRCMFPGKIMVLFLLCAVCALSFSAGMAAHAEDLIQEEIESDLEKPLKRQVVRGGKWVKSAGGTRYKRKNGKYLEKGWYSISGNVYYINKKGYVQKGVFTNKGNYYFADAKGRIQCNTIAKIKGKWYGFDQNGKRLSARWYSIKGKVYYFQRNGQMAKNCWVVDSYTDKKGVRVTNSVVDGRVIDKSGKVCGLAEDDKVIIVGASRIVDMSCAVNSKDTIFIAQSGQGYRWLLSSAHNRLVRLLDSNPNCKVVFQLGNNDLYNVDYYIRYYEYLMSWYPDTKFFFCDALPGDGKSAQMNSRRRDFNNALVSAFGNRCIGGFNFLISEGFSTVDGVHYTDAVNKKMYRYIMKAIGE